MADELQPVLHVIGLLKTEHRWRHRYLKQSQAQKEGGAGPNLFMQLQIVAR